MPVPSLAGYNYESSSSSPPLVFCDKCKTTLATSRLLPCCTVALCGSCCADFMRAKMPCPQCRRQFRGVAPVASASQYVTPQQLQECSDLAPRPKVREYPPRYNLTFYTLVLEHLEFETVTYKIPGKRRRRQIPGKRLVTRTSGQGKRLVTRTSGQVASLLSSFRPLLNCSIVPALLSHDEFFRILPEQQRMQRYSFFILSNTLQFSSSIRLHSDCNMTMFCQQILTPLIHHHRYFTRTLKHLVVYEGLDVSSLPSSGLSNLLRLLQSVTSLESIEFHGLKCPQQQQQQQGHSREPLQFFKLLKRLPLRRLVIEDCGYYEDVDYFELEQDDSVFKNTIEELSVMHSRSYEITRSISSFKNLRFLVLRGDYGQTSVENVRFAAAGALSKLESLDIGSKELDLFRQSPILLPKLRTFKANSSVGSRFLEFLPQLDRLECSFDTHSVEFDYFNRGLRYLNNIDASYWTIIDEDESEDCVCEDVWEEISSSFLFKGRFLYQ